MSKGSHDCRLNCRGCGHYVDLVAGECPVCELVHYSDIANVEPQKPFDWKEFSNELHKQEGHFTDRYDSVEDEEGF